MVVRLKGKNLSIHNEFEINFLVKSKKNGKYIKNDDVSQFLDDFQIQKKVGIIGGNSSGKTSLLRKFMVFTYLQDFIAIWNDMVFMSINELKYNRQNSMNNATSIIGTQNSFDKINYDRFLILELVNNSIQGLEKLDGNDKKLLLSVLKKHFELFFSYYSFDSNNEKIFLELEFIKNNKKNFAQYTLHKNGILQIRFLDEKQKQIYVREINWISLEISDDNKKITEINGWRLQVFDPSFDSNFNSITQFPFPENKPFNFAIIHSIFDYVKINNKKNQFLKWMQIADSSIIDLIMENNTKLFNFLIKKNIAISVNSLSLGTKKWLILYYHLFLVPNNISKNYTNIFLFDEIENSFHYKLVDAIFAIFNEKQIGQLLFTTHNPYIFNDFFRHDGIYLTNLENGSFKVKRLDELKLKKDIVVCNQYLKEKIGEHPNLQNILDFLDHE